MGIKFLLGKTIDIGKIKLKPLTINEIIEVGFDAYNKYLSILCIDSDSIKEMMNIEDETAIEPFEYLYWNCKQNEETKNLISNALNLFLKEQVYFYNEGFFSIGELANNNLLTQENFNYFIDTLKQQNCIEKQERVKPQNDKQRDYFAKLKEMKKKYAKYEQKQDISDIISSVCSKHPSINLFNVGDLTIYQLIDQFKRLNAIDSYFLNVESLLHGADSKDIKLIHYANKMS